MSKKLILTFFIALPIILICYLFIDIPMAIFFKEAHGSDMEIFQFLTQLGDSKYSLIISIVLFFYFRLKQQSLHASRAIFVWFSIAFSGILADILKFIFGRARPSLFFEQHIYGFEFFKTAHAWTSFPSGHSATAFSLGVSLAILFPKYKIPFLIIALLIASSRIIITAHFVSDVVAGSAIGIITVIAAERYFGRHKCFNIYEDGCKL